MKDGQPIWRLEIVGEKAISKAVGTLGQSLQNVSEAHLGGADSSCCKGSDWGLLDGSE